jgi:uncharacterized protein YndB with AHSA1/START domain
MSEHIRIGLHIATAPQRVFQALTQADQLTQWFAEHADVSRAEERYDFWDVLHRRHQHTARDSTRFGSGNPTASFHSHGSCAAQPQP